MTYIDLKPSLTLLPKGRRLGLLGFGATLALELVLTEFTKSLQILISNTLMSLSQRNTELSLIESSPGNPCFTLKLLDLSEFPCCCNK